MSYFLNKFTGADTQIADLSTNIQNLEQTKKVLEKKIQDLERDKNKLIEKNSTITKNAQENKDEISKLQKKNDELLNK